VDREAIARAHRRRQAQEALEFEHEREEALRAQLEAIVAEREGRRIDELAFASMQPEDVEVVREAIDPIVDEPEDEDWLSDGSEAGDEEEHEAEIARLEEALVDSRRRQEAFDRYLAALGE
jgi:hypothetical protein